MEATKKSSTHRGSRRDLMLRTWAGLGQPGVGKRELRQIRNALVTEFGPGAVEGPAAIARVLAGEGAQLRHPEVIEFDAEWRAAEIDLEEKKFALLPDYPASEPLTFEQAETLIEGLETLRRHFEAAEDAPAILRLTAHAGAVRESVEAMARGYQNPEGLRAVQVEISEWLKLWIQTPSLFADWLELRKSSPDFRRKFTSRD